MVISSRGMYENEKIALRAQPMLRSNELVVSAEHALRAVIWNTDLTEAYPRPQIPAGTGWFPGDG